MFVSPGSRAGRWRLSDARILQLLKQVDGVSSGLDADLFDGLNSPSFVRSDTDQGIGAGYATTAVDDGTKSSGTYTPTITGSNMRRAINNGAHTLAAPTASGDFSMVIQYTNGASAGTITFSGFSRVTGDALTTTNGNDANIYITKINGFTHAHKVNLQ